jgi:D-glycero-alpha-D-manno-heptose 1-phosphate guanylyltransferase
MNSINAKVVLLVGGLGTRLRPVLSSAPKVLASVGNGSFLDLLLRQLRNQGLTRIVMCTGYMADQVENAYGNGDSWELAIEYSRESQPMGTAGALKLAAPVLQDSPFSIVMNGDSFLEIDLESLLNFHRAKGGPITVAVVRVPNTSRYGKVVVGSDDRIARFEEKTGREVPGLINAGIYVIDRDVLRQIPDGPGSLERDVFPQWLERNVYAFESSGVFIDIGTPEDYAKAQAIYERLESAASHARAGITEE